MKFASIGTRAAFRSRRRNRERGSRGFALLEALAALALLLAFAAAAGPLFHHSRRILARGDGEVRAELVLHSLLGAPLQAEQIEAGWYEGEAGDYRWRVAVEPFDAAAFAPEAAAGAKAPPYDWRLYRVAARVVWADGRSVGADTLRLGRAE